MSMGFNKRNFILLILLIFLLVLLIPNNIVLEKLGLESILYNQFHQFEDQLMHTNSQNEIDIMAVQNIKDTIYSAIMFGVMISLIIFNVILSFRMRDKIHFFVALFFTLVLAFQLSYNGMLIFFNEGMAMFWSSYKPVLLNLMMIALIALARSYLQTMDFNERTHNFLAIIMFLPLVAIAFFFIGSAYLTFLFTGLITTFSFAYLLSRCIVDLKETNSKEAKLFIIAILFFILGSTISLAAVMQYIDSNYFTVHAFTLSSSIAIIIVSYSVTENLFLLHQKNVELKKSEQTLTLLSLTDELTKLYNRRYFNERLKHEVSQAQTSGSPLTLMLIDIDHFKKFNDTYGHQEGDKALTKLGKIILENIRQTDYACRYGGEEFGIILPDTSKIKADKYVADRLHRTLEKSVFQFTRKGKVFVTVSIGICELQPNDTAESILEHTDEALYKAKKLGRNRTVIYDTRWARVTSQ